MTTPSTDIPEVLPVKRPVGRPAKVTTLVPERSIRERAEVINKYHTLSRQAAEDAVSYAVMAGMELAAAKARIDHGSFQAWIEQNCEFSYDTARRYIMLAEKMALCGAMKEAVAQLPGGQVQTVGDRKALLAAIRETADGHTLQQLYFDFNILRPPSDYLPGGAREGAGRPKDADLSDRRRQMVLQEWEEMEKDLSHWVATKRWKFLDDQNIQRVRQVLKAALNLIPDPRQ